MKKSIRNHFVSLILLLAGCIWGFGFIAVDFALASGLTPAISNALRFSIASVLVGCVFFREVKKITRDMWKKGILPAVFMAGGFLFQTTAQNHTSPSNVAFITALYIIFVPILSRVLFSQKVGLQRTVSAIVTFVGIAILSLGSLEGGGLFGNFLALCCALVFAMHFLSLSKPSKEIPSIQLTFIQMTIGALCFWIYAIATDPASISMSFVGGAVDWSVGIFAVAYLGIFSSFVAYLIQTYAQARTTPTKTAILMSVECPIGGVASVLFGLEAFSWFLVVGGAITMAGVLLTEIKLGKNKL